MKFAADYCEYLHLNSQYLYEYSSNNLKFELSALFSFMLSPKIPKTVELLPERN